MRIAYLHQYFNTPGMSGGTRSYEFARRLVASGHEVHMITTRRDAGPRGRGWTRTRESGIDVHWLSVPYDNRMGMAARLKAFGRFALAASRRAVGTAPDVVFATSTPLTIALPAAYARWRRSIPMVFEVRDLWPEIPIAVGALRNRVLVAAARGLEQLAYRNAAHVVALSPGMKEGVVAAGYPAERVSVIPNAADLEFFDVPPAAGARLRARHDWLGDRPLVVYTGTLGLINGVGAMVDLAAAVRERDPSIRFAVVGTGREEAEVRRMAEARGVLDRNFFMMGSRPKREIPAWLSAADVATSFVIDLPVLWANSANKFFDALAAGTPLLINYGGWQAELIREEGLGLVLEPGAQEQGTDQLVELLRDRDALAEAGTRCREVAAERFHRDDLAARLQAILEEAAAGD